MTAAADEFVPPADDPVLMAAFELIGRTGASGAQIRYSDDEQPVVWMAVATYKREEEERHEVAAALHPRRAFLRLAEQLVDGGFCTHCHRPTGLEPDSIESMPVGDLICWYQYDPELRTFRRGCE